MVIIGTCLKCRAGPHIYLSDITVGHNSRIAHLTRWTFSDTCLFAISLVILASWRCLWKISSECYLMYQSIPKPPIPPGKSPGIWLALSSVQWGIWPKMRPARWGICLSWQNVCQRSEARGFRNSLIQQVSRVHGFSTWVFLLLSFYIVLSWNMPLFKVWSEDKLNKKFVVAENFAELVSTVCFTCLEGGGFDPLRSSNGWGIWPSKLAT